MKKGIKIGMGLIMAFVLICVLTPINVIAEGESVTETFSSISEVTAVATITLSGEDASDYRFGIDYAYGDGNEEVTSSEVDAFEDAMEEEMKADEENCDYPLDGNRGTYTNIIISVSGATGSVDTTDEITIEGQTKIAFSSIDKEADSHSYKVFMDEDEAGVDYKLTVPSGYKIESVKGITDPVKSNGDRTVEGKSTSENIEVNIVKVKEDSASSDSPGFELLGVGVAIGVCAVLLARKRKK